jgi:hypothetical protein
VGQEEWGCEGLGEAILAAAPSRTVGQMLGGDTVETSHSSLEAAVVGIDVLDVKSVTHDTTTCTEG